MATADPLFPIKPAESIKIMKAHNPWACRSDTLGGKHPLEGKSVRAWVAEARAGWPRVPVPGDPLKAAQKVAEKYDGTDILALIDYENGASE